MKWRERQGANACAPGCRQCDYVDELVANLGLETDEARRLVHGGVSNGRA